MLLTIQAPANTYAGARSIAALSNRTQPLHNPGHMLHYYKFRQDLFDPEPAKDIYGKTGPGHGRPEHCPPIRAGNAFGFDLLANFDVTFIRKRDGSWTTEKELVIQSDFDYSPPDSEVEGQPLVQEYAWFWKKGQTVPHVIHDNVFDLIKHQVKVSSFLYLKTDPNELLLFTEIPLHARRPWSVMTALVDTDWYPASYPWHIVLELSAKEKKITIRKGEPLCRVIPLRRDTYFAGQMSPESFDEFFERGQRWLSTHGRPVADRDEADAGTLDITRTYAKQQIKSRFVVLD